MINEKNETLKYIPTLPGLIFIILVTYTIVISFSTKVNYWKLSSVRLSYDKLMCVFGWFNVLFALLIIFNLI